jgi:hypothetical protein
MKEAFFILLVLVVLAALTAYRYRRGIWAFLEFWRMLRSVRERAQAQAGEKQINTEKTGGGPLVNCPKCGKWISEDEAIRLGRSAYYCSTNCLQASTKTR